MYAFELELELELHSTVWKIQQAAAKAEQRYAFAFETPQYCKL